MLIFMKAKNCFEVACAMSALVLAPLVLPTAASIPDTDDFLYENGVEDDIIAQCGGTFGDPVFVLYTQEDEPGNGFVIMGKPYVEDDPKHPGSYEEKWRILLSYTMTDSNAGSSASTAHAVGLMLKREDGWVHEKLFIGQKTAHCKEIASVGGSGFDFSILGGYIAYSGSVTCGVTASFGWPSGIEISCSATAEFDFATRFSEFNTHVNLVAGPPHVEKS